VQGQKAKPTGGLKWPDQKTGLRSISSVDPAGAQPVAGALFCTPAQDASSLLHDNARTVGLPSVAMLTEAHVFDVIQENSLMHSSTTSNDLVSPGDLPVACHSTPTLQSAGTPASGISPPAGTAIAGGCMTAVGNREGTPAFGAVEGIDDAVSCTGTDCSITPEISDGDNYVTHAHTPSTAGAAKSGADFAAVPQSLEIELDTAPRMKTTVNEEDGSAADVMISPWLQKKAEGVQTGTRPDGDGGFGSPVGPGAPWTGFDATHAARFEASY
jgi:hypothetical protein